MEAKNSFLTINVWLIFISIQPIMIIRFVWFRCRYQSSRWLISCSAPIVLMEEVAAAQRQTYDNNVQKLSVFGNNKLSKKNNVLNNKRQWDNWQRARKCSQNESNRTGVQCIDCVIDGDAVRAHRLAHGVRRMQMQMEFGQKDGRLQEYGDNAGAGRAEHRNAGARLVE